MSDHHHKTEVIVLGGGIIGLFSAYYLTKAGKKVTILDQGDSTVGASHGNCGLISPSHVLPLNSLALVKKATKWLFKPDAPFFIKPQADLGLYTWLIKFLIDCRKSTVRNGMFGLKELLLTSKDLYTEILAEEKFNCEWEDEGILFACKDEKTFDNLGQEISMTSMEVGINADAYVGRDLYNFEPALKENIHGAWLYQIDAHLRPDYLVRDLKEWLKDHKVEFVNCTINKLEQAAGRITGVDTSSGYFNGEQFVLSAGAQSTLILKKLGIHLPVIPGKGYSITMKKPEVSPKIPVIFQERKVVATPWNDGTYRLGGTMELAGFNNKLNPIRIDALKNAAQEYLKDPYSNEVHEEWTGWRSMTPNGLPFIDQSPKHSNLIIAFGHNMLGLSTGPATGTLIRDLILEEKPSFDYHYFKIR